MSSAASLGAAMRDLHDDVASLLTSFRDAASMHAWAGEAPHSAMLELRTRFAAARTVKTPLVFCCFYIVFF
jgi:hypothetical protein